MAGLAERQRSLSGKLKAGDFNGNGKLDNADYQALRAMLREKGTLLLAEKTKLLCYN